MFKLLVILYIIKFYARNNIYFYNDSTLENFEKWLFVCI